MRGRKPNSSNVVPLTDRNAAVETQGEREARFARVAHEVAKSLRPRGLDEGTAKVWDRLAPRLAHPTVARLRPHFVESFVLMCQVRARYEALRAELAEDGEVYHSTTRNGTQWKSRPQVGQMNAAFAQFVTLARDFGLTPAADRAVSQGVGMADLFDEETQDVEFA